MIQVGAFYLFAILVIACLATGARLVAHGVTLEAERILGDSGRVLLRPSGTEQLVRVMVEAPTQEQADSVAARLADVVASVG